jgi:hypothetical protein
MYSVAQESKGAHDTTSEHSKNIQNKEVVPGIEPGLPEYPDVIRIRSDNRYTTQPAEGWGTIQ